MLDMSESNAVFATSAPKISIGMPVFNGEAFIEHAISSLRKQTEQSWELIISDNDSSDRTGAICQALAVSDPRIRYIRQAQNLGAARNFEFVFRESSADYFMWAAADDIWDSQWLEHLSQAAFENPGCCVFGELRHIDEFGVPVVHTANGRLFSYISDYSWLRRINFYLEAEAKGKANAINALYPRAAIDEYLPTLLACYGYGDCVTVWRLLQKWKFIATNKTFMSKRLHYGAMSAGMPTTAGHITLKGRFAGLWFRVATQTSIRGVTDYFRSECSLISLICLALLPVKVVVSLWQMRIRPAVEVV